MKTKFTSFLRVVCPSLGRTLGAVAMLLFTSSVPAQNVFVSGSSGNIYQFTPGGTQSTFASALVTPSGLAFDGAGDLFAGDNHTGDIYEFKPGYVNGQTPITFASGFSGATGLAFDKAGNLYMSMGAAGSTIFEFAPGYLNGQTPITFATGLIGVEGLAFDSAGNLYAAGSGGANVITKITPGHVKSTLPLTGLNEPGMLAFDTLGDLFIANNFGGNIIKYSAGGVESTLAGGVGSPYGLAFNNAGILFEGDANTPNVNEFTSGGTESPFVTGSGTGALGWMAIQGVPLPVPEPSTWGLLAAGFTMLLVRRFKHSRRLA